MRVLKGREHFECAKNDIIREEYLKVKEAAKFNPMDEKKSDFCVFCSQNEPSRVPFFYSFFFIIDFILLI